MACIVLKKLLGYELCILEKEGTLFYSDPIVIIRKKALPRFIIFRNMHMRQAM